MKQSRKQGVQKFAQFYLRLLEQRENTRPLMKTPLLKLLVQRALADASAEEIAAKAKPCSATSVRNAAAGRPIGPKLARRMAVACGATRVQTDKVVEESLFR